MARRTIEIPVLRPVKGRRAFEEILQQLETAIADGQLVAGDRLPSERELAARFAVSRPSVREALRVLEALGVVRVRRGADNGATVLGEPGSAFTHLLRFHLALRQVEVADLIRFRVLIESWAAAALARVPGRDFVAELEDFVAEMEDDDLDQFRFHELDTAFHLRLVQSAGNEFATLVLDGSRNAIRRTMLDAILDSREQWPSLRGRLAAEHLAVVDAIRRGEEDEASARVEKHILGFYEQHLENRAAE